MTEPTTGPPHLRRCHRTPVDPGRTERTERLDDVDMDVDVDVMDLDVDVDVDVDVDYMVMLP